VDEERSRTRVEVVPCHAAAFDAGLACPFAGDNRSIWSDVVAIEIGSKRQKVRLVTA